jgi:hypothetical protein
MKHKADKKRTERELSSNIIYFKLQPYVQLSAMPCTPTTNFRSATTGLTKDQRTRRQRADSSAGGTPHVSPEALDDAWAPTSKPFIPFLQVRDSSGATDSAAT